MHVNSPRSTKNLGACSPRETHMKEPTGTHEFSSYVLLVGMPICPNAGKQVQTSLRHHERKMPRQGPTPSPRQKRLVMESAPSSRRKTPREAKSRHLVKISLRWFLSLEPLFSLLCLMGCLRVKGEPQASRLAGSYFLRPHAPPGLVDS